MQYDERFDVPATGHGFKVLQCFYKMVGHDGELDLGSPCFCIPVFLLHVCTSATGLTAMGQKCAVEVDEEGTTLVAMM